MAEILNQWLSYEWHGISTYSALLAFAFIFTALALRRILVRVVLRYLLELAARTKGEWDETVLGALRPPLEMLVLVYGIWLSARTLLVPMEMAGAVAAIDLTRRVLFLLLCGWGVYRVVGGVDYVLRRRAADPSDPIDLGLVPLITNSLRIFVVLIFTTMIAQALGYSVGGLVASLGLGGAAVALASRDAIANLFGFLMILVDKPFRVGDWIKGEGFEGVVEEIGFRSTRIRTFAKTVENIPNNLLANTNVQNMDRRKDRGLNVRRISMTVGVTYSTSAEQMAEVLESIRAILAEDEGVDKRMTTLVNFTDFGSSSLDIFIYYFANKAEWQYYLQVRERVNLKIMSALKQLGVQMAFPSRSVYVESLPDALSSQLATAQGARAALDAGSEPEEPQG